METKRLFGLIMLVLFLLASQEASTKTGVEAKSCELRMHGIKGRCLTDHDCGHVCRKEGFSTGKCEGLRRHCFCTRC